MFRPAEYLTGAMSPRQMVEVAARENDWAFYINADRWIQGLYHIYLRGYPVPTQYSGSLAHCVRTVKFLKVTGCFQ